MSTAWFIAFEAEYCSIIWFCVILCVIVIGAALFVFAYNSKEEVEYAEHMGGDGGWD